MGSVDNQKITWTAGETEHHECQTEADLLQPQGEG